MEASSGSGEHEDKRWSFEAEIEELLDFSVRRSFSELEQELKWFECEKRRAW